MWIVGGALHYARFPRELWAQRIHAAKLAGLNTIETPVFWNRHEPRPGHFDFKGDNDLRHFIQLIHEAGMRCILRLGPFVGSSWDLGGIPAWLQLTAGVELRTANAPFLEATSKYISAVADQIKDLQASTSGGGPIVLIQNEHHWTCGLPDLAKKYLGEINRYFRESGLNVPVININNLWQSVEGEIEAWTGSEDMLAIMRQLGQVAPKHPRLVADLRIGQPDVWNQPKPEALAPGSVTRTLAEVLAGGGQFVATPFCGGTNFDFFGGRAVFDGRSFMTTSNDQGAPLTEGGVAGDRFGAVRRISSFASVFSRVFANTEPGDAHAVVRPDPSTTSVVHLSGSQGNVAFVFHAEGKKGRWADAELLMPDGQPLPVPAGKCPVSWVLMNTHLNGRSRLDYSTFSVVAGEGRMLLVVGPDAAWGTVSVNHSPIDLQAPAPKDKQPVVLRHEGVTIVLCNETQFDHVYPSGEKVYTHVHGITSEGDPIAAGRDAMCIEPDGTIEKVGKRAPASAPKIAPGPWTAAVATDHTTGSSPRFARVAGPATLTELGTSYGYGWYRLTFKNMTAKKPRLMAPLSGDRLHGYLDGETIGISGHGPNAEDGLSVPFKKTSKHLVILADNLGRYSSGSHLGDLKGLYGHLFERAPFKIGRVSYVEEDPIDLLAGFAPMWETREGDVSHPLRASWSFIHRKKSPLVLTINEFIAPGVLLLNGKIIRVLDRAGYDRIVLDQEQLVRGGNTIQITFAAEALADEDVKDALAKLAGSMTIEEGTNALSEKADWAFAKWEPPAPTVFRKMDKAQAKIKEHPGTPVWWKTKFALPQTSRGLFADLTGMTKGQLMLNGHNVGRYWVATADGKAVPPQTLYYLPEPWLDHERENELMLFDEHGGDPTKIKLVFGNHPLGVR